MAQQQHSTEVFCFCCCMFGFGYALVPFYDVFVMLRALMAKPVKQVAAVARYVDMDRLVTVEFDTNVNPALPWNFEAVEFTMKVHPGAISEAVFVVENTSDKALSGRRFQAWCLHWRLYILIKQSVFVLLLNCLLLVNVKK